LALNMFEGWKVTALGMEELPTAAVIRFKNLLLQLSRSVTIISIRCRDL
jgi:hypothetical protein